MIKNDASAPKPCLNTGSSADENFTVSKTAFFCGSSCIYIFKFELKEPMPEKI